jgi:hypothetical protein
MKACATIRTPERGVYIARIAEQGPAWKAGVNPEMSSPPER